MFQAKFVEKIKTHILYSITFFSKNRAVYEITWKNIVQSGRPQMAIWLMPIACGIHKVTHTHSEYVILIAFPPQQWLHESASVLRSAYIACLIIVYNAQT
jgi:hypothetical protein